VRRPRRGVGARTTALALAAAPAVAAALTLCATPPAAAAAAQPPGVKPTQELARLLTSHAVFSAPDGRPLPSGPVPAWRPITGTQTVLPVVDHATSADGARWLRVMLPGRPNEGKGWIEQRGTLAATTRWHLVVKTSRREVRAYRAGHLVRTFPAVVGKPTTPTPRGRFFVEESVRMLPGSAGTPYALATSARSDVLQEFEGGPGQIALHGVGNLGGTPGTAVSHGCVRLADAPIRWLAARIGPGVRVTIVA
jgi:lipoprotein-anchoring transpeptidase ErfK/SrfK